MNFFRVSPVLFALVAGCSSSSSGGSDTSTPPESCIVHPDADCSADQVCWPQGTSAADLTYACVGAKSGAAKYSACEPTLNVASCDHDLMCFGMQTSGGAAQGECLAFCSLTDQSACAANEQCEGIVYTQGATPQFYLCVPASNGAGGSSGAGGTSSNGGSAGDSSSGGSAGDSSAGSGGAAGNAGSGG